MSIQIGNGCIHKIYHGGSCVEPPIVQIIDFKAVEVVANCPTYRLVLSDGTYFMNGLLDASLLPMVSESNINRIKNLALIRLDEFRYKKVNHTQVIVVVNCQVVAYCNGRINKSNLQSVESSNNNIINNNDYHNNDNSNYTNHNNHNNTNCNEQCIKTENVTSNNDENTENTENNIKSNNCNDNNNKSVDETNCDQSSASLGDSVPTKHKTQTVGTNDNNNNHNDKDHHATLMNTVSNNDNEEDKSDIDDDDEDDDDENDDDKNNDDNDNENIEEHKISVIKLNSKHNVKLVPLVNSLIYCLLECPIFLTRMIKLKQYIRDLDNSNNNSDKKNISHNSIDDHRDGNEKKYSVSGELLNIIEHRYNFDYSPRPNFKVMGYNTDKLIQVFAQICRLIRNDNDGDSGQWVGVFFALLHTELIKKHNASIVHDLMQTQADVYTKCQECGHLLNRSKKSYYILPLYNLVLTSVSQAIKFYTKPHEMNHYIDTNNNNNNITFDCDDCGTQSSGIIQQHYLRKLPYLFIINVYKKDSNKRKYKWFDLNIEFTLNLSDFLTSEDKNSIPSEYDLIGIITKDYILYIKNYFSSKWYKYEHNKSRSSIERVSNTFMNKKQDLNLNPRFLIYRKQDSHIFPDISPYDYIVTLKPLGLYQTTHSQSFNMKINKIIYMLRYMMNKNNRKLIYDLIQNKFTFFCTWLKCVYQSYNDLEYLKVDSSLLEMLVYLWLLPKLKDWKLKGAFKDYIEWLDSNGMLLDKVKTCSTMFSRIEWIWQYYRDTNGYGVQKLIYFARNQHWDNVDQTVTTTSKYVNEYKCFCDIKMVLNFNDWQLSPISLICQSQSSSNKIPYQKYSRCVDSLTMIATSLKNEQSSLINSNYLATFGLDHLFMIMLESMANNKQAINFYQINALNYNKNKSSSSNINAVIVGKSLLRNVRSVAFLLGGKCLEYSENNLQLSQFNYDKPQMRRNNGKNNSNNNVNYDKQILFNHFLFIGFISLINLNINSKCDSVAYTKTIKKIIWPNLKKAQKIETEDDHCLIVSNKYKALLYVGLYYCSMLMFDTQLFNKHFEQLERKDVQRVWYDHKEYTSINSILNRVDQFSNSNYNNSNSYFDRTRIVRQIKRKFVDWQQKSFKGSSTKNFHILRFLNNNINGNINATNKNKNDNYNDNDIDNDNDSVDNNDKKTKRVWNNVVLMKECNSCHVTTKKLKKCKKCKIVYYCSKLCQKRDWNEGNHRLHCMRIIYS